MQQTFRPILICLILLALTFGAVGVKPAYALAPSLTVTINQAATQPDQTYILPIHFTAVFSESVGDFTKDDISFSGSTATGTLSATVSQIAPMNGTTYDVAVTGLRSRGWIFVSIPAHLATSTVNAGLTNQASTSTDNSVVFDYIVTEFESTGFRDGWVLESTENSGLGGSLNSTAVTLAVGDDASDRQYRAVLNFDTSWLPDNMAIYAATLKIVQSSITGTNPFTTHGLLRSEIKSGFLGTSGVLQITDFESAPNQVACNFEAVPQMSEAIGASYRCPIFQSAFKYINLKGSTQFRLRFTQDDNDDMSADSFNFYSGNFSMATQRPRLFLKLYMPSTP